MPYDHASGRVGLARCLSKLGYCSRSEAAKLIRAGRVRLNREVRCDLETPVRLDRDRITVDGHAVDPATKIYLMMNKPRGLVTTASDEKGRATVYSLLGGMKAWVAPVGRLDKASEGLLLLTNDSEWGACVAAPETHLEKTYHVQIGTLANDEMLASLTCGVEDGDLLRARQARVLRSGEKNCWLEIVLDEGKNRQIRRMLSALGVEVLRLVRVAIGPLQLGDLQKGSYRPLTAGEKRMLDQVLGRGKARVGANAFVRSASPSAARASVSPERTSKERNRRISTAGAASDPGHNEVSRHSPFATHATKKDKRLV